MKHLLRFKPRPPACKAWLNLSNYHVSLKVIFWTINFAETILVDYMPWLGKTVRKEFSSFLSFHSILLSSFSLAKDYLLYAMSHIHILKVSLSFHLMGLRKNRVRLKDNCCLLLLQHGLSLHMLPSVLGMKNSSLFYSYMRHICTSCHQSQHLQHVVCTLQNLVNAKGTVKTLSPRHSFAGMRGTYPSQEHCHVIHHLYCHLTLLW